MFNFLCCHLPDFGLFRKLEFGVVISCVASEVHIVMLLNQLLARRSFSIESILFYKMQERFVRKSHSLNLGRGCMQTIFSVAQPCRLLTPSCHILLVKHQ